MNWDFIIGVLGGFIPTTIFWFRYVNKLIDRQIADLQEIVDMMEDFEKKLELSKDPEDYT